MARVPSPEIDYYGDSALLVSYKTDHYSEAIYEAAFQLAESLRETGDWTNIIPAYDSVMFTFDPTVLNISAAKAKIEAAIEVTTKTRKRSKITPIDIPVYYGGEYGPDMETICKAAKLSEDKVIKRHSKIKYRVCMMGFIPGFAFLSETDKKLHHPRHATPRGTVAPGSIGIANWQTGIYGLESPGGWQIIGRTPLAMFDAKRDNPFLLKAGDYVRFVPTGAP